MNFQNHVEGRLQNASVRLGLSPLAKEILKILTMVDCRDELAEELRKADAYDRPGVLSWKTLAEQVPATQNSLQPLERAVISLADWGLIQIVGRSLSDPIAPGPSALRLTYAGRVCIGLSPAFGLPENSKMPPEQSWSVLHCASRERLLQHCISMHPTTNEFHLVANKSNDQELERICGMIAIHICTMGVVVVDAFQLNDASASSTLHKILRRTKSALAPRYLLLPEPTFVRTTALAVGATLTWIEPVPHVRREKEVLDQSVSTALLESSAEERDVCGVPDSDIAQPKRCNTVWSDLILPSNVQFQLQQAMKHATYRLEILPNTEGLKERQMGYRLLLSGLPGTGKSMTAEALATALDKPLVKLDLSSVLSKWLGETEKLIGQVFDVSEAAGAVLVLDEAEAILRQRSNSQGGSGLSTGVAYMLTRFDRYQGVLVATTNRIEDLDEAFFRRFDDYAVLPIPDRTTREKMWKKMLGENDESIDYRMLGTRFAISGGLIKGAAIRARGWAIGLNKPLSTPFVLASLARELEKNNRSNKEAYIPEYRKQVKILLDGGDLTQIK
jgi:hypothetical protein